MENRRFNIAFTSKEGNKVKLTLSADWLIADSTAADFKKVMKEYFMPALEYATCEGNETETDKISGYTAFIREKLETWNKTENGNNKTVKSKLTALNMFSGKKASKKSNFEKAANIILKNAKKKCTNTNTHAAIIENDNVYVTDSFVIIRTSNRALYNGFIAENGLKCEQLFTSFSANHDICKVFIPNIETVKANQAKGKNESYFVTFDHTVYDINLIYAAMLAVSFDNSNNCYAYKRENNALSLLYLENTENHTSALIMPIKPRETALMNAVQNNTNVIISCDENGGIIGVNYMELSADINVIKSVNLLAENYKNNTLDYCMVKEHYTDNVVKYLETCNYHSLARACDQIIEEQKEREKDAAAFINKYMPELENYIDDNKDPVLTDETKAETENAETKEEKNNNVLAYLKAHFIVPVSYETVQKRIEEQKQETANYYRIAGINIKLSRIETAMNNKEYLIKGHTVYCIVRKPRKGYAARKVYETPRAHVPIVNRGSYALMQKPDIEHILNRNIPHYLTC